MKHEESTMDAITVRLAQPSDATAIAAIYNEGIQDGVATFEVRLRTAADIESWFDGQHPIVVCIRGETIAAFASTSTYRGRPCYAGIAEFSVYVSRQFRSQGLGRLALERLTIEAENAGFWKLLSRIFPENEPSRHLVAALGFREVGVYEKHGKLDGTWRDVVIVERVLNRNLSD